MNKLICRRVVVAGTAAAAGLAALKTPAHAQTQTKPAGVSPAELAKHEKFMRLAIAQATRDPGRPFGSFWSTNGPARWWPQAWPTLRSVRWRIPS